MLARSRGAAATSAAIPMGTLVTEIVRRASRCAAVVAFVTGVPALGAAAFPLRTNDVVAFLGGANVVAAQRSGHVETLLTLANPGHHLSFRGLAWEGDTVFARPRELNYPTLAEQLRRTGATVVVVQFGQTESMAGAAKVDDFVRAYGQLLDSCAAVASRFVLVTPPPFERPTEATLPDLTVHNTGLVRYAAAIREIAAQRGATLVDLAKGLAEENDGGRLTRDGWQLTSAGQARVAAVFARQLGLGEMASRAGRADGAGKWSAPGFEPVRAAVAEKNTLWFRYARPTNWAFLAGDRTEQPSSRDHRDPKVRWFPSELEQFVPLIAEAERRIEKLAQMTTEASR